MPTDPTVRGLIESARLVANYGVRSGRITDAALHRAIAHVERNAGTEDERTEALIKLNEALAHSIAKISPITLLDLSCGRDPTDPKFHDKIAWKQKGFAIFSIVLVLIIGVTSFTSHHLNDALAKIDEINAAHPRDQYSRVWNLYRQAPAKTNSDLPEMIVRELGDLRNTEQRILDTMAVVEPAASLGNGIFFLDFATPAPALQISPYSGSGASYGQKNASLTDVMSAAAAPVANGQANASPGNSQVPILNPNLDSREFFNTCGSEEQCRQLLGIPIGPGTSGAGKDGGGSSETMSSILMEADFYLANGFTYSSLTVPDFAQPELRFQDLRFIIGGWLTPFLFGLLGASVFCTRSFMGVSAINMPIAATISRVVMGGVAGIAMGWLWGAAPTKDADISILGNPGVIAFITGYSIEILYSLIDKANRRIIELVGGQPSAVPPAPQTGS